VLQSEVATISEQPEKIAGVVAAGDDDDVVDTGAHERLDGIEDHGLVVDRQQVLVRDPRERIEAAPRPAREHDALHRTQVSLN